MNQPPPMPPEASPWALAQAVGKSALADAWLNCFQLGKVAGSLESGLNFGIGFLGGAAAVFILVGFFLLLVVAVLGVASFIKAKR